MQDIAYHLRIAAIQVTLKAKVVLVFLDQIKVTNSFWRIFTEVSAHGLAHGGVIFVI